MNVDYGSRMSRQAEISAESRMRLLVAAWELLAEGGTRATTVQAVSERAKISRGSIAWHFGSKEGLIVAVVNNAFDTLAERITALFESGGPHGWEQILNAQGIMLADERFRIFGTLMLEALTEKGPVTEAFADGQSRIRDIYAAYIAEHDLVADGVDPVDAATAIRALTLGLNVHRRFDADTASLPVALSALRAFAEPPVAASAPRKRAARVKK